MLLSDIQPWGTAPTPLLPEFIRIKIGHLPAPKSMRDLAGKKLKLADLDASFWQKTPVLSKKIRMELSDTVRNYIRKMPNEQIWKKVLSREQLLSLPFSERTKNIALDYTDVLQNGYLTFKEILSLPKCGAVSAIEFASIAEAINQSDIVLEEVEIIRDPVITDVPTLTRQILDKFNKRLRIIAKERIFKIGRPTVLELLGKRFGGITRERVRQVEAKIYDRLEIAKNNPDMAPVFNRALELRRAIGNAIPASNMQTITDELKRVTEDFDFENNEERELVHGIFLWLAGPFKEKNGWVQNQNVMLSKTVKELIERENKRGLISDKAVESVLNEFDIKPIYHASWISHLDNFRKVDKGFIVYKGSIIQKSMAYIKYRNEPVNIEELAQYVGSSSVRSTCQRMISSGKLWRINRANDFVIAGNKKYREYRGITTEIIKDIEENGGEVSIKHLVKEFAKQFGVRESSVIGFLGAPLFEKKDGMVSIREDLSGIEAKTNILQSVSCYKGGTDIWLWRTKVDNDTMRGSGRQVSNGLAKHVGCEIGKKINVETEYGKVTFSWPIHTPYGASIGSLRKAALNVGAKKGDYLFVRSEKGRLTFRRLSKSRVDNERVKLKKVALLMGAVDVKNKQDAIVKIGKALAIRAKTPSKILEKAKQLLLDRYESDLADLIN